MSFRRRWLSTAIALTVAACAAGTAQTVTVDVQDVPLHEVIEQLKLETEADIRADGLAQDVLAQPVTYTGTDVPLKRALREICGQVGLRLHTYGSSRTLGRHFRLLARGLNEAEPPTVQAGPYLVRLLAVTDTYARKLDFRRLAEPLTFRQDLELLLEAEADTDEDAAALLRFDPAIAVTDNTGKALEPVPRRPEEGAFNISRQTMSGPIMVSAPAPEAITLAAIVGELVVAAEVTPLHFEFDAAKHGVTITTKGYTVTLDSVEVTPEGECEVALKLVTPPQPGESDPQRLDPLADFSCFVVLKDGTELRSMLHRSSVRVPGQPDNAGKRRITYGSTWRSSRLPPGTKPAKVLFGSFAKSAETKRIPFKFENIPLPTWGQ